MKDFPPGTLVRDTLWPKSLGIVLSYDSKLFSNRIIIFWRNGYVSAHAASDILLERLHKVNI